MPEHDRIDELAAQWSAERPDVDAEVMASVGRLLYVARLVQDRMAARAAEWGLQIGEGDVLFTLRRSGAPYRLSPSRLAESTLVTTGTMTNRLDKLEARGFVRRVPNPSDRRGIEVELTPAGRRLVDEVVGEHVENEREMLAGLSEPERAQFDRLMRTLLAHLTANP